MKPSKYIGQMTKGQRKSHKATSRKQHGDWMAKLENGTNWRKSRGELFI